MNKIQLNDSLYSKLNNNNDLNKKECTTEDKNTYRQRTTLISTLY